MDKERHDEANRYISFGNSITYIIFVAVMYLGRIEIISRSNRSVQNAKCPGNIPLFTLDFLKTSGRKSEG